MENTSLILALSLAFLVTGCASSVIPEKTTGINYSGGMAVNSKTKKADSSSRSQEALTFAGGSAAAGGSFVEVIATGVLAGILGSQLPHDNGVPEGKVRIVVTTNDCWGGLGCSNGQFMQPALTEMQYWKLGEPLMWDKTSEGISILRMKRSIAASAVTSK
ncbi:MAG: hypothetical protein NT086_17675 [Proteobacteria bacterium]|nr:hypothetical protein [Pseudomonadota bacterium]